ncbi:MFS transporter [Alkalibacterium psychrotolerans]
MTNPAKSLKHWLVLAIACGMSASAVGINLNVIGVFYTPVSESLNVYRGTFAMHATLSTLALSFVSLYFAPLLNRFGWKPVLTASALLASLSTILMAFTTTMWVFYLLGILRGIGTGLYAMVPLSTIVNNWFEKKKGFAMSLSFGFSGIIGAIFSPVFTSLIESVGWENSFIVMGLVMFLFVLPAILYPYSFNPKDDGYLPYGHDENEEGSRKVIRKANWTNFSYTQKSFVLLALIGLMHTSITGISQHLPGFAESNLLSTQVGGIMLSAVMVGNISFKLLIGFISDTIGVMKAAVIMILINIAGILLLLSVSHPAAQIAGSFVFGSVFSVPAVAFPLLTTELFGKELYVRIFPIISFIAGVGGALSMTVVGYVFDFTGSYVPAFVTALVFHGINLFILFSSLRHSIKD